MADLQLLMYDFSDWITVQMIFNELYYEVFYSPIKGVFATNLRSIYIPRKLSELLKFTIKM